MADSDKLDKQKAGPHEVKRPIVYDASGKLAGKHPLSGQLVRPTDQLKKPLTFEYLTVAEYETLLGTGAVAPKGS